MSISRELYMLVMSAVILAVTAYGARTMLVRKCPACGRHSLVGAAQCRKCGHSFAPGPGA